MRQTHTRYSQGTGLLSVCQMRSTNDAVVRFNTLAVSVKLLKRSEACGSSQSLVCSSSVPGPRGWGVIIGADNKQQLLEARLGHVEMQATDGIDEICTPSRPHNIHRHSHRLNQHVADD